MGDFGLGPYCCGNPHHALLHHVLGNVVGYHGRPGERPGIALEFGVGDGSSLRCISRYLPAIGFDSFQGLPEDWREGFPAGSFAYDYEAVLDNTPPNVKLVPGWFEDTLVGGRMEGLMPTKLVHIDCDLYSSTKTVLDHLPWANLIRNRAVICFDEWWGYPGAEDHEQRAWREFVEANPRSWDVIGHGVQQWAIQLNGKVPQ